MVANRLLDNHGTASCRSQLSRHWGSLYESSVGFARSLLGRGAIALLGNSRREHCFLFTFFLGHTTTLPSAGVTYATGEKRMKLVEGTWQVREAAPEDASVGGCERTLARVEIYPTNFPHAFWRGSEARLYSLTSCALHDFAVI